MSNHARPDRIDRIRGSHSRIPPKVITPCANGFSNPVLDGILNEPQWEKARPILDFTQI